MNKINKSVYVLAGNIDELPFYYGGYFQKGNPCVVFDIESAAMFSTHENALIVAKYAEGFDIKEHTINK